MKFRAKEKVALGKNYWRLFSAHAISNLGDGVAAIAYPWLASAVTRSPFLIALVAVASRLPWLIFTLPAGVITDRFNRGKIIVAMDIARGSLALLVAIVVTLESESLPKLNEVASLTDLETNWTLYLVLVITALLFGFAEVLRDNSAQTLLPSIVEKEKLESANGKLWSVEYVTNSFVGPPLGSFLLGIAIFLPFYIDSASFFISAALIATLIPSLKKIDTEKKSEKLNFRAEIKEGFTWLWSHELLRPMALILGALNAIGALTAAVFILFAQEILETSVFIFAVLGTAGAVGGSLGGILGPKISKKLGSGPSLYLTLLSGPIIALIIGLSSSWHLFYLLTALATVFAVLWNVITVSLRQSIIPSHLLGRVNSVYRFFAWGSIPIGTLLGGALVDLMELAGDRDFALRSPYFLSAILGLGLFFFAAPRLTTAKIEAARGSNQG
ncbi:MAG: MFS transporter [Actinobacteria bacterium]|nr:MFS transporter [Actinomycetota bacterium]